MNHEKFESSEEKALSRENTEKLGKITTNLTGYIDGSAKSDRAEKREKEAREELEYWAGEYRNIELAFSKREKKADLEEYEKWENEAKMAFSNVEKTERSCRFASLYEKDATERLAAVEGKDSIEAYAGNFYDERNQVLVNKIMKSNSSEAEKDVEIVGDLHILVYAYINACKDYKLKGFDPLQYQNNRKNKHNNMIERLNNINELAEKYNVTRLTFRNFITNDFPYDARRDSRGETNARAEYDRSSVENYIRTAFSSDFRELDEGNGDTYYNPNESLVKQFHSND